MKGCLIFIVMDPDFALGILKTISTFLDFFDIWNFSKTSFKLYDFPNFESPAINNLYCIITSKSFEKKPHWLAGYVGVWLAFRPGDWGSNLTWAKKIFPYIDNNFQIIYILAKPEWPNRLKTYHNLKSTK